MTTASMNVRPLLAKAYEEGRQAGILEAVNREKIIADLLNMTAEFSNMNKELVAALHETGHTTLGQARKGHAAPKAPVVARGVKKAPMARTKGVKEAIVKLLQSGYMTIDRIVAETGFKENSVRGTLMTMKKNGQAFQDGKNWAFVVDMHSVANGPAEGASAND